MSVVIALHDELPSARKNLASEKDREPPLCWRELVQFAMEGALPSEQRLENLLDRIEGMP